MTVDIREGTIEEALLLASQLPEFDIPPSKKVWQERLQYKPLILIVSVDGELAGFKVGYDRWRDGRCYYSWIGGVLPPYRRSGLASSLQRRMEDWCRGQGFTTLRFKTRNRFRHMITFAIKHGFNVTNVERKGNLAEYRIWLEKAL